MRKSRKLETAFSLRGIMPFLQQQAGRKKTMSLYLYGNAEPLAPLFFLSFGVDG